MPDASKHSADHRQSSNNCLLKENVQERGHKVEDNNIFWT